MYLEEIHRQVKLPLLRKDFVVDEYQIYDAKLLGASAVLLICSLLKEDKLKRYHSLCGELGLAALVEAHDDGEVAMAAEAGARIIGINNRNLKTFEVDFSNALRLRRLVPKDNRICGGERDPDSSGYPAAGRGQSGCGADRGDAHAGKG